MNATIQQDVVRRLVRDFEFKVKDGNKYLQQGVCPSCHKRELFTSIDSPWILKCGRENNCGYQVIVKEQYPEIFEDWSKRYKDTPETPHAAAEAYLREARGLDTERLKGCFTQGAFVKEGMGSATVKFHLQCGASWERIIDQPQRFGKQKANIRGSYVGHWWVPPFINLLDVNEIWITEGIFNALSLCQAGLPAVATLSSNNYPLAALDTLAKALGEKPRPRLVWAFDGDKAGKKHTLAFAARSEVSGWKTRAAQPVQSSAGLDWNDLLIRDRFSKSDIKNYRYYGSLLLAKSPTEKALLMHQHNEWHAFYFEHGFRMYWFELDLDRYTRALERITQTGSEVIQEWEAKERAVKESGCVSEIANCWLTPLYFQESKPTDEAWYYVKVSMPGGLSIRNTFTANQLTSSAEFKKRLLHIAKGAVYTGSTKQLDKFTQMQLPGVKTVETQNFIGYNKDYAAWVFNRVAVSGGKLYEMNDEDYFEIERVSVKSLSLTPSLDLNPKLNEFTTGWIDDIWTAFGEKGYVALAFWLGSLFAEQIRERDKSFPFLEIVGEPGTGKSTLIEFLWKLAGREEYEGFDPSKSTAAARGRNFAQVGNLPVVLIEGDRTSDNAKQRAFDWDELKSLYNGRASRAVGIKSNNNETYEPPFRGSIVIAQNADTDGSKAFLERIIHIYTDKRGQSIHTRHAAERLEQLPVSQVSGFTLLAAMREKEIMQVFGRSYELARNALESHENIRHIRIAKNHAQLVGLLDALALVVPMPVDRIEKTRDAITALAVERCQALKKDHPMVQEFWELFDYLDELAPYGINHSSDDNEIAVNFNHVEEVAATHRQRIPFTLTEIKKLLKNGNERRYIDAKTTRSAVSERHNRGKGVGQRMPETFRCWLFSREK
ncbi:toprim domain-containing protein [Pectobacterium parmentieri]|uniref:toprim domain-containing protein n=1 Tax=Pectobacterium parmentieri TaxID=1905730 RepID=UPI003015AD3E